MRTYLDPCLAEDMFRPMSSSVEILTLIPIGVDRPRAVDLSLARRT